MSSIENLTVVFTHSRARWRRPRNEESRRLYADSSKTMRLSRALPDKPVSSLSGGNQQKIALGKWLLDRPRLLLLDEPTRGVDVAAKAEIHRRLRDLADSGVAILVSSSENPELLELCDRVAVMFGGRLLASLDANEATEAELARFGGGST
jgi:ABC-type sugar transport system ATPase subunit